MFINDSKTSRFALVLLLVFLGVLVLFETRSGSAKHRQPLTSIIDRESNFAGAFPPDDGDIQLTITKYYEGAIFQQTVTNAVSLLAIETSANAAPSQTAVAGDIVISQIYSHGGDAGSTYQNNYLEFFNRTDTAIDINGWRIYLASDTEQFNESISISSSRGIVIGSHRYFSISFGPTSSNGAPVPADIAFPFFSPFPGVPGTNLSPAGKIFLAKPNTSLLGSSCPLPNSNIVDFVGYGTTANCFEGSGPTATTTNTTAILRKVGGCTDTDSNSSDFLAGSPTPRNSGSPTNNCTSPPNPIDGADFFVRQHYADFLNRQPDAAGLSFWTNQITSCGTNQTCVEIKRVNVSAAFFLSIEFQETGYLVYRTYKAAYGNLANAPVPLRFAEFLPDTQQISQGLVVNAPGWEQQLENNKVAFFLDFVSRLRFRNAYPTTLSPAEFVDALFTKAVVTPSASARQAAIDEFGTAADTSDTAARARALRRVAENPTLDQQEKNKAFVLMQYFGYLRRNPDDPPEPTLDYTGYNFWLNKLNQFNGNFVNAEMVKAFINSSEYRQRF